MPVEVRELIIKATVTQDSNAGSKAPDGDAGKASHELIKACVEKVMEIIKDKHGR